MTTLEVPQAPTRQPTTQIPAEQAAAYAAMFACLGEPMRVRMLHAVASAPAGACSVGELADLLSISQSTASHHVRRLADAAFVHVDKRGTTTVVSINAACCTGLPHAADVVMGALVQRPCCPTDLPADVQTRAMTDDDLDVVRTIYVDGIETGQATFETRAPTVAALKRKWLDGHRWVAELDGIVVGWAAAAPVSTRACYAGVAETSVYVDPATRGRGIGKSLLHRQVTEADDAGLWTLQCSIFPENRGSLALHHAAGFRTVGLRERIAQQSGRWRDTVLLERRSSAASDDDAPSVLASAR